MPDLKNNLTSSAESKPLSPKKSGKHQHLLIILTIIVICLLGVGIGFSGYFFGYKQGIEMTQLEYNQKIASISSQIPGILTNNQEVKSISGKILTVSENEITFEAAKPAKTLLELNEKVTFKTKINDKTEISSQKMTLPGTDKKNPEPKIETKKLKISDLKKDENAVFYSETDLYGQTEFTAVKIIKNEAPATPK